MEDKFLCIVCKQLSDKRDEELLLTGETTIKDPKKKRFYQDPRVPIKYKFSSKFKLNSHIQKIHRKLITDEIFEEYEQLKNDTQRKEYITKKNIELLNIDEMIVLNIQPINGRSSEILDKIKVIKLSDKQVVNFKSHFEKKGKLPEPKDSQKIDTMIRDRFVRKHHMSNVQQIGTFPCS